MNFCTDHASRGKPSAMRALSRNGALDKGSVAGGRMHRAGRFANERGAAMVEGVIVVTVLVILFISAVFLGGIYKAKLLAMQDARGQNMYNATNNCEPKGFSYENATSATGDDPSLPAEAKGLGIDFLRTVVQGGGVSRTTTSNRFSFGPASNTPSGSVFPHYDGRVSGQSFALCNEKPVGVNLAQLIIRQIDLVSGMIGADVGALLSDLF